MTALLAADVRARLVAAAATADDPFLPRFRRSREEEAWRVLSNEMAQLLDRFPRLAADHGYGWAADPAAYRSAMDMYFQLRLLQCIADVDPAHPNLVGHIPIAVTVGNNRDFFSHSQPGFRINVVLISRGYLDFARYFMEYVLDLVGLDDDRYLGLLWDEPRGLARLLAKHEAAANQAIRTLLLATFDLLAGHEPRGPATSPLQPRLEAAASRHPELLLTYDAVESFLLAHEVAHLLEKHPLGDRSIYREMDADRAAASLTIARVGSEEDGQFSSSVPTLQIGVPLFFALADVYFEFSRVVHAITRKVPLDYHAVAVELGLRRGYMVHIMQEFGFEADWTQRYWPGIDAIVAPVRTFISAMPGTDVGALRVARDTSGHA